MGHIHLPAGSYEANGEQALDYVRVRHAISANGDVGRMKRQQAFLAAMATKAISAGTLSNPVRLYSFLDAATKSLTTDPALASLRDLTRLARELSGIGPEDIEFLTVPFEAYAPDPNRLVWAPQAEGLWDRLRTDTPLSRQQRRSVTAALEPPAPAPRSARARVGGGDASRQVVASARQTEAARENGLCT